MSVIVCSRSGSTGRTRCQRNAENVVVLQRKEKGGGKGTQVNTNKEGMTVTQIDKY